MKTKNYNEIDIEKKLFKDLISKEMFEKRKKKSKSPSSITAPDSPQSNLETKFQKTRKTSEFNDNPNLFT